MPVSLVVIPSKGIVPQYYVEGSHEPIIPSSVFEIVISRIKSVNNVTFRNTLLFKDGVDVRIVKLNQADLHLCT